MDLLLHGESPLCPVVGLRPEAAVTRAEIQRIELSLSRGGEVMCGADDDENARGHR